MGGGGIGGIGRRRNRCSSFCLGAREAVHCEHTHTHTAPSVEEFARQYTRATENLVYVPSTRQLQDKKSLKASEIVEVVKKVKNSGSFQGLGGERERGKQREIVEVVRVI